MERAAAQNAQTEFRAPKGNPRASNKKGALGRRFADCEDREVSFGDAPGELLEGFLDVEEATEKPE